MPSVDGMLSIWQASRFSLSYPCWMVIGCFSVPVHCWKDLGNLQENSLGEAFNALNCQQPAPLDLSSAPGKFTTSSILLITPIFFVSMFLSSPLTKFIVWSFPEVEKKVFFWWFFFFQRAHNSKPISCFLKIFLFEQQSLLFFMEGVDRDPERFVTMAALSCLAMLKCLLMLINLLGWGEKKKRLVLIPLGKIKATSSTLHKALLWVVERSWAQVNAYANPRIGGPC